MGIVVVGGQARKVGKTAVVAGIIAALPHRRWTAVKITQCHHSAPKCHCELGKDDFAVSEELQRDVVRDTSRYLAAGAESAYWMRSKQGALGEVMPALRELMAGDRDMIIESNGILEFVKPDVFLCVAGAAGDDVKLSYERVRAQADAFVLLDGAEARGWDGAVFFLRVGESCSRELAEWIDDMLQQLRSAEDVQL